jgi:hypothetical protein
VLSIPITVTCHTCAETDLPWWQVGILTVVACLIAYGLLWALGKLLTPRRSRGGKSPTAGGPTIPPVATGPPQAAPGVSRYRTIVVNQELRYALEFDDRTGRCYVTIPVSNRLVDYEEAYEVDRATFEHFRADPRSAAGFLARCRNRELDHLLREQPGADRGAPS